MTTPDLKKIIKHPNSKKKSKQDNQLGDPPSTLSTSEKEIWYELIANSADGALAQSDRMIVEIICVLLNRFRVNRILTGPEWSRLVGGLGSLGMTPVDRARISVSDNKEQNPFSEFVDDK